MILVVAGGISIIPSKAVWVTVGDNVNKAMVLQNTKRNWCWAFSGAKMLECLGVTDKDADCVALSAGHDLLSDRGEGLVSTLNVVRNLLPLAHQNKNSNFLSLRQLNNGSGTLMRIDQILQIRTSTEGGNKPYMMGKVIHQDFPEVIFLANSLRKGVPVLANLNNVHVVLVTGLEIDRNRIRYWDLNRGEVEENFIGEFTNNRTAYATFS